MRDERFEDALPVRSFQFERAAHFAGWWYFATTGTHVGFESWLERDHLYADGLRPGRRGGRSQPFWLRWQDEDGRARRHAPDYFARRADGSGVVVDVRPDDRIPAEGRGGVRGDGGGLRAGGLGVPPGGDDRPGAAGERAVAVALPASAVPPGTGGGGAAGGVRGRAMPLLAGAALAGDPVAVLPVAYHLLWRRELACDLSVPAGQRFDGMAGRAGPR